MAFGDQGGVLSYATDENVWLAEPNAESFARAIREVFFMDAKVRHLKIKKALETAAQNTWELSSDRLFALYDKLYEEFSGNRQFYDYRKNGLKTDFSKDFASKI